MEQLSARQSRDWMAVYRLAEQYFRDNGHLLIPGDYVCQGRRLGAWIGTQRQDYRTRTNREFTQERIDLLNAIGMVWDVRAFQWDLMCAELRRYRELYGSARVPQSYVTPEGRRLGIWLNGVRMDYKRGRLSEERRAQLEALGVVWTPETLRRGRWDRHFARLQAYVSQTGQLPPAKDLTDDGFQLGEWLSNQRRLGRAGRLSAARRQKLEALGVIWDVKEDIWLRRYRQARDYYLQHGHLSAYQHRSDALPAGLSQWLTAQRRARQAGALAGEKVRRLEEIGMVWDVRSDLWESFYRQAADYYRQHGHLRVPKDRGEHRALGRWINTQRMSRREGKMDGERIRKLDAIGMVWNAKRTPEELWEDWLQRAAAFYQAHGHLNPQEGKLRTWVLAQRAKKKGKRGCLTEEQIRRLEEIGMIWEPVSDQWQAMYQHARDYYAVHQMLNVPCGYVTESGARLGNWIARQRHCYRNYLKGKRGGGRGIITPERIALLNQLGMIWDGSQVTAKTSFQEKAILFYLKAHFPDAGKLSQWQQLGVELDLYLPGIRTAVEYDGFPWHADRLEQDERKGELCRDNGIRLIRLREPGLPRVRQCDQVIWLEGPEGRGLAAGIAALFCALGLPCPQVDLRRDRPAILETYRNDTARAWDRAYQALHRFWRERGTLSVPAGQTSPDGVHLAGWINAQREAYRNNELTGLQVKKLEALGMQWAPFEERWRQMYRLAAAWAEEHGNLQIPAGYVTAGKEQLGAWLASQRELYRKRELSPRRVQLLERLGILWNPSRTEWEKGLAAAQDYRQRMGNLDVPSRYVTADGFQLGQWLYSQRRQYREGRMTEERVRRLEALGIHWTSAFFRTRWEEMFAVAAAYFREHGDLWMPPGYVTPEGKKLGVWVARQRSKRSGAGGSGALTREQERRLEEIGMVWDPYTAKWMEKYRLAEAFYRAHGHLKIPVGYVTEDGTKLGMWIASQRQAMGWTGPCAIPSPMPAGGDKRTGQNRETSALRSVVFSPPKPRAAPAGSRKKVPAPF